MTTAPRRTLRELGHMLALQARLLKAEEAGEATTLAMRAGDCFRLARMYPAHQPIPIPVRQR